MTKKLSYSATMDRALAALEKHGPMESTTWSSRANVGNGTLRAYIPQMQADEKIHISRLISTGLGWPIRVYAFGPSPAEFDPPVIKRRPKRVIKLPSIPRPDMLTAALMGI